jgi:hypothetical protein
MYSLSLFLSLTFTLLLLSLSLSVAVSTQHHLVYPCSRNSDLNNQVSIVTCQDTHPSRTHVFACLWYVHGKSSADRLDLFAAVSREIYQIEADTDVADMASLDELVATDLLVEPTSTSAVASGAAGGDHDAVAAYGRDGKSGAAESSAPAVVTARLERRAKSWAHVPLRVCFVPMGMGHDDGSTPAPPICSFTQLPLKPKTISYVTGADVPV